MEPFTKIKSIAVIGAGPAGLAAVKYLKAEQAFEKIVVFEQRSDVGGVWNYTPVVNGKERAALSVPRTEPSVTVEVPSRGLDAFGAPVNVFDSPIYDSLETNIPHTLMNFTDKQFPQGCPLFPPFQTVKNYLSEYAEDITGHLKLHTQVNSVQLAAASTGRASDRWKVTYTNLSDGIHQTDTFDAIVCATGHYSDPFIPDIPGIRCFQKRHPDIISHSKYYRNPTAFANKKIVVVGNSASGVDISRQISTVTSEVLVSEKEKGAVNCQNSGDIRYVPEISEFIPQRRTVHFLNGHTESDIDSIIFCTGYQYSFPFLSSLDPPATTTGVRTNHTYQHIFYAPQPTLAFLTLPQRIVPFPVAEAQAAYVARVFSGRLNLSTTAAMASWEAERLASKGEQDFHTLGFPEDVHYINMLHDASVSAKEGPGKDPPFWDEEKSWIRQQFPMIKQAAMKLGSGRQNVTSLEDLGFKYIRDGALATTSGADVKPAS